MMNTAIIGQVADFSQNKLGSKPGKTSGESPEGESFSEVFADASRQASETGTPKTGQSDVSEIQSTVADPETTEDGTDVDAAGELVEASDDQADENHPDENVSAVLPVDAQATPEAQTSTENNSVLEGGDSLPENATLAETGSGPETDRPVGGEQEPQVGADGTGQPAGEDLPLAGAGAGEQRAQQSAANGNALENTAKASVPTDGKSQTTGISNAGPAQPQPGAQQRIAVAGETPANGPVTSQQPIGAGLTQAEVHAELARTSTGSIEDLPLAYRVRLGALSPAAQQAIHEGTASAVPTTAPAAPAVTPVSPVAAAVQNELALRQASEAGSGLVANAPIDLPEGVELVELDGVELSEPATASKTLAAAPTAVAAAVSVNTPRPNPAGSRADEVSEAQLDEISSDEIVEGARLPGEITREGGVFGSPSVSQAALLTQIGQAQNSERFGHGAQQDFRLGPQAIGITQSLTEATFRPATMPTPEVAQRIAVQLTEAFAAKGERKVEVMLNPKELGQVKMQLSTSENGVRVIIHAERSETGDLMRRHISALEGEFKDMGFENISFSFSSGDSQSQSGGNNQSDGSARHGQATADEIETAPVGQQLNLGGSGLDMRV